MAIATGTAIALGAVALGSIASAKMQSDAAKKAGDVQAAAARAGISEEQRQFEAIQALFKPYIESGNEALTGLKPYAEAGAPALAQQQALLGLSGPEAQKAALDAIKSGSMFSDLTAQGEDAILQNASATGGLRGGNTQAALAQFRPAMLNELINQQYSRLGGLTQLGQTTTQNIAQLGQASAANQAAAGLKTGADIAGLLGEHGAAQAGAYLGQGRAWGRMASDIGDMGFLYAKKKGLF
jgi:hypothetical protein